MYILLTFFFKGKLVEAETGKVKRHSAHPDNFLFDGDAMVAEVEALPDDYNVSIIYSFNVITKLFNQYKSSTLHAP